MLVELEAAFPKVEEGLVTVQLVGGPCDGRHEHVAGAATETWARVGKPGGTGVETQMWSRYDLDPIALTIFRYSGVTVTTNELEAGIRAMQADGHTFGESRGA